MKLTFNTKADGSYYELVKDTYGFNLYQYTPIKEKKANTKSDKTHGVKVWFYANIQQAAEKVTHLELEGHNITDLVNTYVSVMEKIEASLTKLTKEVV